MPARMLRHLAFAIALTACACSSSAPPAAASADTSDVDAPAATEAAEARSETTAPASTAALPPAAQCVAPPGAVMQDVDPEDEPEVPFAKVAGQKITVFFQNSNASERYLNMVKTGAATWSQSPCIDAEVVDVCPEDSNCVTVRTKRRSEDDDDTDGELEGDDHHGVRRGGTLTIFTGLMDKESDNGALATIVHEMGHAFGLVHRNDEDDLMNADTDDDTNPVPDSIDFENLLVLYGSK
jgi:hypothetical protein